MTQNLKPPQNLEELKQIVDNINNFSTSFRTELDQRRYELYRKTKQAKTFVARIKYQLNKSDTSHYTMLNEFKYSYLLSELPEVKHLTVWFDSQASLNENLKEFKKKGLVIQNQTNEQSVCEIPHLHLFMNE